MDLSDTVYQLFSLCHLPFIQRLGAVDLGKQAPHSAHQFRPTNPTYTQPSSAPHGLTHTPRHLAARRDKTVGNGRKNVLIISAPVFLDRERERKREREGRTRKQNRYYGISGTEYFERKRVDYDREEETQDGNIDICNHLKQ